MLFHIRTELVGQWTVVRVVGEVDLATAPQYRKELRDAANEAAALAIDLTSCDLIDSVGLGVTLGAARKMFDADKPFAVLATGAVRRTLQRCRLDEILDLVDTIDALTIVGGQRQPTVLG